MNSNIPVVFPFHVFVSSVSLQPSSDAPTTSQHLKSFRSASSDIPHIQVLFHFSPALPFLPYFHLTSNCIRCPALSFHIFHPFTSLKERKTAFTLSSVPKVTEGWGREEGAFETRLCRQLPVTYGWRAAETLVTLKDPLCCCACCLV